MYLEVLRNKGTHNSGVKIARVTKPVPATSVLTNIRIPSEPNQPTVFINGDKAPFFDGITKYRGLQARYSQNGEIIDLDLGEEMQKCGLLTEELPENDDKGKKAFKMGNVTLAAFLQPGVIK